MEPRDRLAFVPVIDRPPLRLPEGIRLIVWPVLALEEWNIARAMPRTVIPPPQGEPLLPDVPNWTWHEYGMRVGFWRLRSVFEELGVGPTVTLNARTCDAYPQVVEACIASRWELNAHSLEQIPMHRLPDEPEVIDASLAKIEQFSGKRPRGWFGPGLTQTYETVDHLAQAGIEYIGDWALDDEPVWLRTAHTRIAALPYNFELHDIVMMALQHHASSVLVERVIDQFEWLYSESIERAKVMSIAFHPYLSGVPHRIRYVREILDRLSQREGVVFWNGEQILDWFRHASS
jgi:allantoinase